MLQSLDLTSSDDRILAHVLNYERENRGVQLRVVTEDLGMRLRCKAHEVPVVAIDPERRLPNPTDELLRKKRRLEEDLRRLQIRCPQLLVEAEVGEDARARGRIVECNLRRNGDRVDIDQSLEDERAAAPPLGQTAGELYNLRHLGVPYVTKAQRDAYEAKRAEYFEKYRQHLEDLNKWREQRSPVLDFSLVLSNTGTSPAEDVDVWILFPDRFTLLADKHHALASVCDPPKPPKRPIKPEPVDPLRSMLGSLTTFREPSFPMFRHATLMRPAESTSAVREGSNGGFEIHAWARCLKHHSELPIGDFVAEFTDRDVATSFSAKFLITAANHPEKIHGEVTFRVSNDSSAAS